MARSTIRDSSGRSARYRAKGCGDVDHLRHLVAVDSSRRRSTGPSSPAMLPPPMGAGADISRHIASPVPRAPFAGRSSHPVGQPRVGERTRSWRRSTGLPAAGWPCLSEPWRAHVQAIFSKLVLEPAPRPRVRSWTAVSTVRTKRTRGPTRPRPRLRGTGDTPRRPGEGPRQWSGHACGPAAPSAPGAAGRALGRAGTGGEATTP